MQKIFGSKQFPHFVGNVGMRGPNENDFSAILVINRVLILAMLVNGFFHTCLGLGMFLTWKIFIFSKS